MIFFTEKYFQEKYSLGYTALDEIKLNSNLSDEEREFISHCEKYSSHKVYLAWINQNKGLLSFIQGKNDAGKFNDHNKIASHSLYGEFKAFVAPFLFPRFTDAIDFFSFNGLSYLELLPLQDRELLEAQAYRSLDKKHAIEFEAAKLADEEGPVLNCAQIWLSGETLSFIDSLSRGSYSFKVAYVDRALKLISYEGCTLRLANWIVKQLEQINLNPEHKQEISAVRDKLRTGEIEVRKTQTHARSSLGRRQIVTLGLLFFLVAGGLYLFIYKPFSLPDDPPIANSSFEQFTKEERLKIDSLLKEIQPDVDFDPMSIDPYLGMQDLNLLLREEFENSAVEDFYQDVVLAIESKEYAQVDSCKGWKSQAKQDFVAKGFKSLKKRQQGSNILLRNESEYDVLLVVFDNRKAGDAYSMVIPNDKEVSFKMDLYEALWLIAGNDWGAYSCSSMTVCPSDDFKSFFCSLDGNSIFSFSEQYTFEHSSTKGNKILLTGSETEAFQLVDIYDIFETAK